MFTIIGTMFTGIILGYIFIWLWEADLHTTRCRPS